MKIVYILAFSLASFGAIAQSAPADTTKKKTGISGWLERRNERLNRLANEERREVDYKRTMRQERMSEVKLQEQLGTPPTTRDAGFALKSGGGLLVAGSLLTIAGVVAGTAMNANAKKPGDNAGTIVLGLGSGVGLILSLSGYGQIMKAGRILSEQR